MRFFISIVFLAAVLAGCRSPFGISYRNDEVRMTKASSASLTIYEYPETSWTPFFVAVVPPGDPTRIYQDEYTCAKALAIEKREGNIEDSLYQTLVKPIKRPRSFSISSEEGPTFRLVETISLTAESMSDSVFTPKEIFKPNRRYVIFCSGSQRKGLPWMYLFTNKEGKVAHAKSFVAKKWLYGRPRKEYL